MRMRWMMLAACLAVTAPALVRAENCAWLNAATAGGLLGSEASVRIDSITEHLTPNQVSARQITGARPDAVCIFQPQQGTTNARLEIAVHTMANISAEFPAYTAACGKDAISLRAVGNEAIECSTSDDKHHRTEKVVARVRDRAFLLSWTIDGPDAISQDAIREKMRNLAEQVAGSIF